MRTSLRRRLAAVVSVAALAAGTGFLVSQAPSAQAASTPVAATSAPLDWGVKASFRSYITGIAAGSITASNGATRTSSITWASAGGSYDPVTRAGTLDYSGKVVFRSVSHTIWHITFQNPTVVFDGSSTGKLLVDVSYATGGSESAPANSGTATDVHFGDVAVTAPTVSGSTYTFTNQAVTLTAAGAESFNGQYAAGTVMDPLTAAATLQAPPTTTPPTTAPPTTAPPTNPPAKNPLGDAINAVVASLVALLGSLGGK